MENDNNVIYSNKQFDDAHENVYESKIMGNETDIGAKAKVFLKALCCFLFPIVGFVISSVSGRKGHIKRSHLYLVVSCAGLLIIVIGSIFIGASVGSKRIEELIGYQSGSVMIF